jgi:cell division protein ZapA
MPEMTITIGGRNFEVSCQEGEQSILEAAAGVLDAEARTLVEQVGRMPEGRMLLMSGLMLADRTGAIETEMKVLKGKIVALQAQISELHDRPIPEPERIEVPVIPSSVTDSFAELAARAEALADAMDDALTPQ